MTHRDVFIVSTARTAIGTFGGALKDVPNTQLATTAVKAAITRSSFRLRRPLAMATATWPWAAAARA